jgi:ribulose-5-phosphate 4-epimerase/fuculose-1-phosphate aldolase
MQSKINTLNLNTEQALKNDLALAYQILAHLKYDDHTYTHLSARQMQDDHAFFIYPFGLRFEEVDASDLMKVSLNGQIIEGQEYQYNKTGYILHGAIYKQRPDIKAIFHLHTPEIVAVSSLAEGLLPINQWALHFYDQMAYHTYDSLALDESQGKRLLDDLGQGYVMLLRNHGLIACGKTIHEAMFYCYHLQKACEAQCYTLAMGREYIVPETEICKKAVHDLLSFEQDLGKRDWEAWKRLIAKKYKNSI